MEDCCVGAVGAVGSDGVPPEVRSGVAFWAEFGTAKVERAGEGTVEGVAGEGVAGEGDGTGV